MPKKTTPAVPILPADETPEPTLSERQEMFIAAVTGGARYNEAAEEAGVHGIGFFSLVETRAAASPPGAGVRMPPS